MYGVPGIRAAVGLADGQTQAGLGVGLAMLAGINVMVSGDDVERNACLLERLQGLLEPGPPGADASEGHLVVLEAGDGISRDDDELRSHLDELAHEDMEARLHVAEAGGMDVGDHHELEILRWDRCLDRPVRVDGLSGLWVL